MSDKITEVLKETLVKEMEENTVGLIDEIADDLFFHIEMAKEVGVEEDTIFEALTDSFARKKEYYENLPREELTLKAIRRAGILEKEIGNEQNDLTGQIN